MLKSSNAKIKKNAFTLLEMMMAVFVIIVGVLGVMSLIQRVLFFGSISHSRLAAAYLAQEGIEIIRNVRDTNWLEATRTLTNPWDEDLTACGGVGFIVDYNHSYSFSQIDPTFPCYSEQYLNIDANGFYGYSSGLQTKFKRKIKISSISPDTLNVLVEVSWTDKEALYSLSVQGNLYNWR